MSKHTPGPWEWDWRQIDGEADCGVRWIKCEGHAYSVCRAPRYQSQEQWEADARLITAAPELLEALIRLVDSVDPEATGWSEAVAAIDKATGSA